MPPPAVPPAVKAALKALPVNDKIAVQSYIAGLRDTIKELENQMKADATGDPHAHFHGHDDAPCTADHGHDAGHNHDESW